MSGIDLDDRAELTDLVILSFGLIDDGEASKSAELFASDARLTFGPGAPKPGTIEGPAIADAMRAREAQKEVTSRHVLSNLRFHRESDDRVKVRSLLTLFRAADDDLSATVRSVADIVDLCVREGGGWRIADRRILPVFNG